jgi:hypothetical protein
MGDWWYRNIIEPGKLPLLLALGSFLATFLITRLITRLIRAGKGPFRNISSSGGVHIHHVVPGVVLTVVGGFGAVTSNSTGWWAGISAVLFGIGTGLVLDEFALILYLDDVYWTERGRKSTEAVVLTAALGGLLLGGFLPFGVNSLTSDEQHDRAVVVATVLVNLLFSLVALFKGKARLGVIGVLVPFVAFFAALRLARPGSFWDERLYGRRPRARARAVRRAARHDARWAGPRRRIEDWLGGTPDDE